MIDAPFISLFGGGEYPFNLPGLCYDAARGKNCYVPITFNSSCRVVAYGDWGKFYQVNYINFPEGTAVEPFELPLTAGQKMALDEANAALTGDLSAGAAAGNVKTETVTVAPGESVKLYDKPGAGAVTGINIKLNGLTKPGSDWDALSQLAVSAFWDGEASPSVWATLGGFFASSTGLNEYSSLPCGVSGDKTMYANWYMPYENGGVIELKNDGEVSYSVTYSVKSESLSESEARSLMRFHAKFVRAKDPQKGERWPDAEFLKTEGKGRFVGTSLHVYKQIGTGDPAYQPDWWWGEGDEKFFVDGEKFPSWFGTGCEDYFGYAWGTWNPFSKPYHSQPFTNGGMFGIGNRLNNRFHIIDSVPFSDSFEGCLEKYHRDGYANWAFTDFWYLEKGGKDPYSPVSLSQRTEYFKKPYCEPQTFYEGEDLIILESTGMMKAETQDMSGFSGEWSGKSQFIFKSESAGAMVKFRLNVPESGEYTLRAAFTKAGDFCRAQHYIDGVKAGEAVDLYNNGVINSGKTDLCKINLTAGYHELSVVTESKNAASSGYFYGLDSIELVK